MKKTAKKMCEIVQKENMILREKSQDIPIEKITSPKIQKIIMKMKEVLDSQDDGVAIAAPQIGVPLRIFVISKKVEIITKGLEGIPEKEKSKYKDLVYINPIINKLSKKMNPVDEGCLSVRYLYGKVERAEKATITAYDETGKKFTRGGSGLLAQIFQHETDHLNGILFIDKAEDIVEILPQNNEK